MNSRTDTIQEINELDYIAKKLYTMKRREKKYEQRLSDLWNNIKWFKVCVIGVQCGEEREG